MERAYQTAIERAGFASGKIGLILALVVLFATLVPPASAQPTDHPAWRFGLISPANVTALDQAEVGWIQLPFAWAVFQPESANDWNTRATNTDLIAAAIDSGREVVGVITQTPAWASESGQPYAVPDGLALPLDDPGNVWAGFVRQLVATYGPLGVRHWIIYDEPNVRVGEGRTRFAGNIADYAQLLKVASLVAKETNPDAVIHVAAMNWWIDDAAGRENYLAQLLRVLNTDPDAAGTGFYFDVITVRVTGNNTAAVWSELADTRAILDAAGIDSRPIWLELNTKPERTGRSAAVTLTPAQTADFVIQAAALGLAGGAERIAFAGLFHAPEESFSPASVMHDLERLPALTAYQTVITLFASTPRATRHAQPGAELIVLEQADHDMYVMWAAGDQSALFSITSPNEGETAGLITAHDPPTETASVPLDWPAVFRVDVQPASRDANGFLTVAGSPVILVLDHAGTPEAAFVRVTYVQVAGAWTRLR